MRETEIALCIEKRWQYLSRENPYQRMGKAHKKTAAKHQRFPSAKIRWVIESCCRRHKGPPCAVSVRIAVPRRQDAKVVRPWAFRQTEVALLRSLHAVLAKFALGHSAAVQFGSETMPATLLSYG